MIGKTFDFCTNVSEDDTSGTETGVRDPENGREKEDAESVQHRTPLANVEESEDDVEHHANTGKENDDEEDIHRRINLAVNHISAIPDRLFDIVRNVANVSVERPSDSGIVEQVGGVKGVSGAVVECNGKFRRDNIDFVDKDTGDESDGTEKISDASTTLSRGGHRIRKANGAHHTTHDGIDFDTSDFKKGITSGRCFSASTAASFRLATATTAFATITSAIEERDDEEDDQTDEKTRCKNQTDTSAVTDVIAIAERNAIANRTVQDAIFLR